VLTKELYIQTVFHVFFLKQKPYISKESLIKGRGAQLNVHNRFLSQTYEAMEEQLMQWHIDEMEENPRTSFIEVFPKNILSKNNSPDIPFDYSINPYNGCEHGCVYCYARNSHEYWGYSAGRDFEEKILYKPNGHLLLREVFKSGRWNPQLIVLSGNTDCYQPAERKFELTRRLLEVFLDHNHPVGIITKNALILRDLDILQELRKRKLIAITLSITTLNEDIRRSMEPRTSSVANRLHALEVLCAEGFPVNVNMAPIIPGVNSDEIFDLAEAVGSRGAYSLSYIMARLNGQIAEIFSDWIVKSMPERAEKVLNLIRETHDGALNDSRFKTRMKGDGNFANVVADMFKVARKKWITSPKPYELDFSNFKTGNVEQLRLFTDL
jgi:DNA repair photolyase